VPRCLLSGSGAPWMLGTDVLDRNSRSLMRLAPGYISVLQNEFSHLENFVDARNARSIRWLRRLGFSIREPRRMGLSDVTFYRFEMGA
jgi:hypothetical protein